MSVAQYVRFYISVFLNESLHYFSTQRKTHGTCVRLLYRGSQRTWKHWLFFFCTLNGMKSFTIIRTLLIHQIVTSITCKTFIFLWVEGFRDRHRQRGNSCYKTYSSYIKCHHHRLLHLAHKCFVLRLMLFIRNHVFARLFIISTFNVVSEKLHTARHAIYIYFRSHLRRVWTELYLLHTTKHTHSEKEKKMLIRKDLLEYINSKNSFFFLRSFSSSFHLMQMMLV